MPPCPLEVIYAKTLTIFILGNRVEMIEDWEGHDRERDRGMVVVVGRNPLSILLHSIQSNHQQQPATVSRLPPRPRQLPCRLPANTPSPPCCRRPAATPLPSAKLPATRATHKCTKSNARQNKTFTSHRARQPHVCRATTASKAQVSPNAARGIKPKE